MSKLNARIDKEVFTQKNNGTFGVYGWWLSDSKEPITVKAVDGRNQKLDTMVQNQERPDVITKKKLPKGTDPNVGFFLELPDFAKVQKETKTISIIVQQADKTLKLKEYSITDIKKIAEEESIQCSLDTVNYCRTDILISGWAIDTRNKKQILALDSDGNELAYHLDPMPRPDVLGNYGMAKEEQEHCGFNISIPRDSVKTSQLIIRIQNDVCTKDISIDLAKYDRGNSRAYRKIKALSFSQWKTNIKTIKKFGWEGFQEYIKGLTYGLGYDYEIWYEENFISKKELKKQKKEAFAYQPLFSIVIPLYNTPIRFLDELIQSIQKQSYKNWELCLADGSTKAEVGEFVIKNFQKDKRIRYKKLQKNDGIAGNTNEAIAMATGEYVVFADHDDLLEPNALFEFAKALNRDRTIDMFYTDEDLVDSESKEFYSPRFKPDFNREYLCCINYICHLLAVKKTVLDKVGGIRKGFDGAQDYDFVLRCTEETQNIFHIPKVLYHWRAHNESTAGNPESKQYAFDAAKHALQEHYQRVGLEADVEETDVFIILKSKLKVRGNPKVSIIILNKDHIDDLNLCLNSILEKTTYTNYEIIIVENNSEEKETFAYYENIQMLHKQIKVVFWEGIFNYSAINNYGAKYAEGDYYLLLNNDIEVISPDWITDMVSYCQQEDIGIVGAKLYYKDDTVQHAGMVIGVGGFAGHLFTGAIRGIPGFFGRLTTTQDISAVTAACLMIKKTTFEKVGGFDEEFVVSLNDVDLCLRVRALGELVVFNPNVELYHYESKSRGLEDTKEKRERFKNEIKRFRHKWKDVLEQGDPYYNPNLTLMYGDCRIRKKTEYFEIIDEIE